MAVLRSLVTTLGLNAAQFRSELKRSRDDFTSFGGSLDQLIRQRRPQLLALGQHSRSVLVNALLGSLPAHYLRQAPCDVLLVK